MQEGETPVCLTCKLVMAPAVPMVTGPKPAKVWPFLVAIAAGAAGVAGFIVHRKHARERELFEARYPITATTDQAKLLETEAARWRAGKTAQIEAVGTLPDPDSLTGSAACTLSLEVPPAADIIVTDDGGADPEELVHPTLAADPELRTHVAEQIDRMVAAAERGRFHNTRGQSNVLRAISMPLVVLALTVDNAPAVSEDRLSDEYISGLRAGTAYAFDPATGKLRCAGTFHAHSSDKVSWARTRLGFGNQEEVLARDLDDNTMRAVRDALRSID